MGQKTLGELMQLVISAEGVLSIDRATSQHEVLVPWTRESAPDAYLRHKRVSFPHVEFTGSVFVRPEAVEFFRDRVRFMKGFEVVSC